ncbi:MAG TPA: DUF1573 domain-containing protein [Phycisphaerae bacterium]|nr:DUF1573 domain-containing protein [Phycisphaerae bacterium]
MSVLKSGLIFGFLLMVSSSVMFATTRTSSDTTDHLAACHPDPIVRDLGTIPPDMKVTKAVISWKNTSGQQLKIDKIVPSCKCMAVKPDSKTIPPGELMRIKAEIDVGDSRGRGSVAVGVSFVGDAIPPLMFRLKYFRETGLRAYPARIDFGDVQSLLKTRRHFTLDWTAKAEDKAIEVLSPIKCDASWVSCRMTKSQSRLERAIDEEEAHQVQKFTFEAALNSGLPQGQFESEIAIPVRIDGKTTTVRVPVTGKYRGAIYAHPPRLVALCLPDQANGMEFTTELFSPDYAGQVSAITATCEDKGINVSVSQIAENRDDGLVGKVQIFLSKQGLSEARSVDVIITGNVEDSTMTCRIPLRIIVVGKPRGATFATEE